MRARSPSNQQLCPRRLNSTTPLTKVTQVRATSHRRPQIRVNRQHRSRRSRPIKGVLPQSTSKYLSTYPSEYGQHRRYKGKRPTNRPKSPNSTTRNNRRHQYLQTSNGGPTIAYQCLRSLRNGSNRRHHQAANGRATDH